MGGLGTPPEFTIVYRVEPAKCQSLITMRLPQRADIGCPLWDLGRTWKDASVPGVSYPNSEVIEMESLLHRLLAPWTKSQEGSPRRSPSAAVRCEPLEGRQLLSTM